MLYEFSDGITEYIKEQSFPIDVVPENDRLPEYPHITVPIKSLSEYIQFITFLYEFDDSPTDRLAFRGVSDYQYSLSPSLKFYQQRNDFAYPYDDNIENKLVDEMLTKRSEEFAGITSNFEILAKMQHLGLPTRLLDFSLNPLVALYFACQSLSSTTARVLCTRDTSSVYSKETIEAVCGSYQIPEFAQVYLEDLVHGDNGMLNYMIASTEPLMAHPKCTSERIRRQSGIFMVFPNAVYDSAWYNIATRGDQFYQVPYNTSKGSELLQKIRQTENPYEIYGLSPNHDLTKYPFWVTPVTFFNIQKHHPAVGGFSIGEWPNAHINNDIAWAFRKRFAIDSDIACISPKLMAENFCSILIDAKYKKSIMRELDHVNINEAFLFPEPEYTAKRIKNRYLR